MELKDSDERALKKAKHSSFYGTFFETITHLGAFERVVAVLLLTIILVSGTGILYKKNNETLVEVPRSGGTHIEGIIGTPRFINPLLASSQAERDLSALVYAGLTTRDEQGNIIPDLAESFTISEDGTVYTFRLKEDLVFHDNTPVTADDVIFTVTQVANPVLRSPAFSDWEGVMVEKKDTLTIIFTLPEPYAPFIENTTLGIMPEHIWGLLTAEEFPYSNFNITPVGAGPYKIGPNDVLRDKSGIPSVYRLTRFKEYALGEPYIHAIEFVLFSNNEDAMQAYAQGKVFAINSISPNQLETLLAVPNLPHTSIRRTPLLRVFGIFFNHNRQPILLREEVREALEIATPKKAIVGEVLRGYGTVLDSPVPVFLHPKNTTIEASEEVEEMENDAEGIDSITADVPMNHIERARAVLEQSKWERGEDGIFTITENSVENKLSFTLVTVNSPDLIQATERIAESWREVGMDIEVKPYESVDLTQSVIRPRRFDALLFGMMLGHELDLYAFWHSSQRNDPGLNIAQYTDIEADALLEKMRTTLDKESRKVLFRDFATLIQKQNAAVFLYSPDLIYVVNSRVRNVTIHPSKEPSERFDTVHLWHIETDNVWPFLKDILNR